MKVLSKIKKSIKFQKMKIQWKRSNRHNYTYPGNLFNSDRVIVGNYSYGKLNVETYECEGSYLKIGNYCSIASNAKFILGGEHDTNTISTYPFRELFYENLVETKSKGEIIVDDDVWIGDYSIILSGVHIGQGAVVAAGSVVTKNVEPYSIVGGVPARLIKYRFSTKTISELSSFDFSKLEKQMALDHIDDLYSNAEKGNVNFDWFPKK